MNSIAAPLRLRATRFLPLRTRLQATPPRRPYSTPQQPAPHPPSTPPNPPHKEPSRVGTFYRTFSYPVLKAFLGALFTYQLAYYAWMKLEWAEEKNATRGEIAKLKGELKDVLNEQRERAAGAVGSVEAKVEEKVGEVKKKGWLW